MICTLLSASEQKQELFSAEQKCTKSHNFSGAILYCSVAQVTEENWKCKQMFSAVMPKTCLFLSSWVNKRPCRSVCYCAARVIFRTFSLAIPCIRILTWSEVCLLKNSVFCQIDFSRQILEFFVSIASFSKVRSPLLHSEIAYTSMILWIF